MGKPVVLLLNPPGKGKYFRDNYCSPESKAGYYWQPIDLLVQSGYLSTHFEVDVIDAIIENQDDDRVLKQLAQKPYVSVLALTGTASWPEDFHLFEKIKQQHPDIIMAVSGNLALFEHTALFKNYPFIDVALLDYTTPDYSLFLKGERENLFRISFKNEKKEQVVFDRKPPRNFAYPLPLHTAFKNSLYHLPVAVRHPSTVVITGAGCPHSCEFCVASEINYRSRNTDNVLEELHYLQSAGFKEVTFLDFMFDANLHHMQEICQRIISEKLTLSWYCTCRVDTLNKELLQLMKKAGCHTIQFGIESSEQAALDAAQKRLQINKAQQTLLWCRQVGIQAFGNFIIGMPSQGQESLLKTGKFARQIGCSNAVFSTLVPDVGTLLRRKLIAEGRIEDKMTRFSSTDKIFPRPMNGMTTEKLAAVRRKVMFDFYLHPSFLFNNFVKARSFYELRRRILYGFNVLRSL